MAGDRPVRGLRPTRFDDLGLRRVMGDRVLPLLVAAMAFLAAMATAGSIGASALAGHWQRGAAAALTVQVPSGPSGQDAGRTDRVLAALRATPGVSARMVDPAELASLLRPWLGGAPNPSLPLPVVVEVHLNGAPPLGPAELDDLARVLDRAAPGTELDRHEIWVSRLSALARSLEGCGWMALGLVSAVAAAVVAIATRNGLVARRETIEIVHGLGGTDGYIASRFAGRATRLAAIGGAIGALAALPVLLTLADLVAPFHDVVGGPAGFGAAGLPPVLWAALPALPLGAALIGFATAQGIVRRWLRRLP